MTGEKAELSAAKKMLLEKRVQGALRGTAREPAIARRTEGGAAPLSFAQQRLWFLDQLDPGSPVYNVIEALRLDGSLDIAALERSFAEVVRRHEVLRTNFVSVEGQATQIVTPAAQFSLSVVDLRDLSPLERENEMGRILDEESRRPFDLACDPMLRVTLLRLSPTESVLVLTMHHIASDAWSIGVLYEELSTLYEGFIGNKPATLPELPIQYTDFAVWQRDSMRGSTLERQLAYWKEQLSGAPELLDLPTDRPRPTRQTFRGGRRTLALTGEIGRKLRDLSDEHGVTFFTTLLSGFKALLYRYTRQDDVVVGSPIAGRSRTETEKLIGFFVNTLALRTRVRPQMSFTELLGEVRKVTLAAYAHGELPFDKVVEYLAPAAQPERNAFCANDVRSAEGIEPGTAIAGHHGDGDGCGERHSEIRSDVDHHRPGARTHRRDRGTTPIFTMPRRLTGCYRTTRLCWRESRRIRRSGSATCQCFHRRNGTNYWWNGTTPQLNSPARSRSTGFLNARRNKSRGRGRLPMAQRTSRMNKSMSARTGWPDIFSAQVWPRVHL